jgi:hypothetical protein
MKTYLIIGGVLVAGIAGYLIYQQSQSNSAQNTANTSGGNPATGDQAERIKIESAVGSGLGLLNTLFSSHSGTTPTDGGGSGPTRVTANQLDASANQSLSAAAYASGNPAAGFAFSTEADVS